ncbi:MAG TPA: hypothetical protein VML50_07215, partial [Anaeromyxobacter sp.]|nr:hypothetical protein [Anaeromyxobacter sp.]
ARSTIATAIPMASPEDVRWAQVRATASRWFARLEQDERRLASGAASRPRRRPAPPAEDLPEVDPAEVIELTPARRAR